MKDPFAERIFGIPWVALAVAGIGIAIFYAFVPVRVEAEGAHWLMLRWGHTVAWIFLALSALARAKVTDTPVEFAAPLAATGGLVYVALMVTTIASGVG